MLKYRLIFSKTDRAIWISHLDTMHTLQRAFVRAGVTLCHSEGYNPHPTMSIALPLSVGMESVCEVLDVKTENEIDIDVLNSALPEGIEILDIYTPETKAAEIKWLEIQASYCCNDDSVLNEFFKRESIVVDKKSSKGTTTIDIKPMIYNILFNHGIMSAIISAQNPTLNPNYIIEAIHQLDPEIIIEDVRFRRIKTLNAEMEEFK